MPGRGIPMDCRSCWLRPPPPPPPIQRNKILVATSVLFSQQKTCFVMTNMFVATKVSITKLVATNVLSQQAYFCRDKDDTCGSSYQWQCQGRASPWTAEAAGSDPPPPPPYTLNKLTISLTCKHAKEGRPHGLQQLLVQKSPSPPPPYNFNKLTTALTCNHARERHPHGLQQLLVQKPPRRISLLHRQRLQCILGQQL